MFKNFKNADPEEIRIIMKTCHLTKVAGKDKVTGQKVGFVLLKNSLWYREFDTKGQVTLTERID